MWRTKIDHFCSAPKAQRKLFAFLRRFRLKYRYLWRAPKALAKILRYFVGRQHMTSFFQIPGGGGQLPQVAPPSGRPWDIAFIGEPLTNKGVWNLRECYIGTSSVIMKFCIENIALHLRLANYACITGQWPKVTANWVQHVQTRPNETCFMHNFHAILNDCKVMYLKYINSFCAQSFGFCFNLNILVKKLGSVFLSRAVWKTVDQFLFALARWPFLF